MGGACVSGDEPPTSSVDICELEPAHPVRRRSPQHAAPTGETLDERSRKKAAQTHNLADVDRTVQTCPGRQSPGGLSAQPHSSCVTRNDLLDRKNQRDQVDVDGTRVARFGRY